MALTEKDVRYVADLAYLELTDEEVRKFLPQLDSIIQYVDKLNKLDTTQVEPMAQVSMDGKPPFRADSPQRTLRHEEALSNAPDPGRDFFKVPRVIERE
jgi:aspartyl-tRNA(Asn)/glutamyl-tRNA(Gln) amidotransferase subunit C